jgi:hypothetical protein
MLNVKYIVKYAENKNEVWPSIINIKPELGHLVKSKLGKVLKIGKITHCYCASLELELWPLKEEIVP